MMVIWLFQLIVIVYTFDMKLKKHRCIMKNVRKAVYIV